MLTRKSLVNITTELVIVVGGILIAFALDAWWDGRQERAWERTELSALREEFARNLNEFETVGAIHRRQAEDVLQIAVALDEAPRNSRVELPDSAVMNLFWWRTTDASTGVLDALLASGQIASIRNPELRRLLAEWPAKLADGLEDEEVAREFVEHTLSPSLAGEGAVLAGYTTQLAGYFPAAYALPRHPRLRADTRTADLLAQRLRHLVWNAANSESLQGAILDVLAVLDRELRS